MNSAKRLLVFLSVFACSEASVYFITPSDSDSCPYNVCLTLSQFAANSNMLYNNGQRSNLSLVFLPGNHTLDSDIYLAHMNSLSMLKHAHSDETVTIQCVGYASGRFVINETASVLISGLHFYGCTGHSIAHVEKLVINSTTIHGVRKEVFVEHELDADEKLTILMLSSVTRAEIIGSAAVDNVIGSVFFDNRTIIINEGTFQSNNYFCIDFCSESDIKLSNSFSSVLAVVDSYIVIDKGKFTYNKVSVGGVIFSHNSTISITESTFHYNDVSECGGVVITTESMMSIVKNSFHRNTITRTKALLRLQDLNIGVIYVAMIITCNKSFAIQNSSFSYNHASLNNIIEVHRSVFSISDSSFGHNYIQNSDGVVFGRRSSVSVITTTFTNNYATGVQYYTSVIYAKIECSLYIAGSTFANNFGGIISTHLGCSGEVLRSTFTNNSIGHLSGGIVFVADMSILQFTGSKFFLNNAGNDSSIVRCSDGTVLFSNCTFDSNVALGYTVHTHGCGIGITESTFCHNSRSLYTYVSELDVDNTVFENCTGLLNVNEHWQIDQEGGAITSLHSTVNLSRVLFLKNQGIDGGAIIAIDSAVVIRDDITMVNNVATNKGGSIFLKRSMFYILIGKCIISNNSAQRGGGIFATDSTVEVFVQGSLHLLKNNATDYGGGIYFELTKLQIALSQENKPVLQLRSNHAKYGGSVYVADDTNAGACRLDEIDCFIQIQTLDFSYVPYYLLNTQNQIFYVFFKDNKVQNNKESDIFGGLLNRCVIRSPVPEILSGTPLLDEIHFPSTNGFAYLQTISNITTHSVSSKPVNVCFCNTWNEIDCTYQPSTIRVKKGETFNMSLVAVDQVNHSVDANIISSLTSSDSGFQIGENQRFRTVGRDCTPLTFNIYSPNDNETINLYADGPCKNAPSSTRQLMVEFLNCTCPIGFQPSENKIQTTCECGCDPKLSLYITNCNATNSSLVRVNSNSWITYVSDTDPPGYVVHPNCPFDYCHPSTDKVYFYLDRPDGADALCVHNHGGTLCGACKANLSLSLGSSRCVPCDSYWPGVLFTILLASIIAGVLLVTVLLALNMTVAVGLINSFIFYANVVAVSDSIFFPSSKPSFPTIFVAWLNLDIGFDVCFFDGLDMYAKTWLQLAFPMYIISLVILVIIACKCSPKFAELIGRKDPVATLATLILMSYAKLLTVTIAALSFGELDYPDGSRDLVWLPDASVKYFQGKHIPLAVVAVLIILVGLPYTLILFLWQWLVRAHQWRIFKWTTNTKLNAFVSTYHAPYENKYRFWTGLLLIVRISLYVISSTTASSNPQMSVLLTIIMVASLLVLSKSIGLRVYKNKFVDILEIALNFNVLALASISLYDFKVNTSKQAGVAYTSTIITFFLLIAVTVYHVTSLIPGRKKVTSRLDELNEYLLAPVQAMTNVTYSVVDRPMDSAPKKVDVPKVIETAMLTYQ